MKTVLKSILVGLVSLPSLVPAAFAAQTKELPSTNSECTGGEEVDRTLSFPKGVGTSFDPMLLCGAMVSGILKIDRVRPSGECPIQAPGVPTMYRSFSGEEVKILVGIATSMVSNQSTNQAGSSAELAFETAIAQTFAKAFKADAVETSGSFCEGSQPAPGTCGAEELELDCCVFPPTGGSGSSSGGSGGTFGQGGGASAGGGGGGGESPVPTSFELIYLKNQGFGPSFIIVDVTKRGLATSSNPFGICTRESGVSGPSEANYNPGTLQADGCPTGFRFTPFGKFMGDMSMAGLAIAVPFAAPAIAPALTIPGVAIGVTVVVGGYLIYRWLTDDTAQDILFAATVTCGNLCGLTNAAAQTAIEVGYGTIAILAAQIAQEVMNTVKEAARRFGKELKGEACCAILCTVMRQAIDGATGCGPKGCYRVCYENCTRHTRHGPQYCSYVTDLDCQCSWPGYALGMSTCNTFRGPL